MGDALRPGTAESPRSEDGEPAGGDATSEPAGEGGSSRDDLRARAQQRDEAIAQRDEAHPA